MITGEIGEVGLVAPPATTRRRFLALLTGAVVLPHLLACSDDDPEAELVDGFEDDFGFGEDTGEDFGTESDDEYLKAQERARCLADAVISHVGSTVGGDTEKDEKSLSEFFYRVEAPLFRGFIITRYPAAAKHKYPGYGDGIVGTVDHSRQVLVRHDGEYKVQQVEVDDDRQTQPGMRLRTVSTLDQLSGIEATVTNIFGIELQCASQTESGRTTTPAAA